MFYILKHYILMRGAPSSLKAYTLLTLAGIAISTAVLVAALSVAEGFELSYKRSILDFNAHVVLLKDGDEIDDYNQKMDNLGKFEGIAATTPFIYRESMAVSKGIVKGFVIKGVDFKRLPSVSNIAIKNFGVDALDKEETDAVFLGKALAEKLDIKSAGDINILIGENRFQKVPVAGIFESGLYDYDANFALTSIKNAQNIFGAGDFVTGIEMKLGDPGDADKMADVLRDEFQFPYQIATWSELNRPIFEAVHLEKIMFAIIIGSLVLVGIFNIVGALLLKILYKVKDIIVLSAIGMKTFLIRVIFTFHGAMLGIFATLAGVAAGVILAKALGYFKLVKIEPEIYFLSSLPSFIDSFDLFVVCLAGSLVSVAVSFAASGRVCALNLSSGLKEG
jgi:lipoprotein-releasing system permease protein